jgi:RNA polymerase sigma factor (sigma-70 family)
MLPDAVIARRAAGGSRRAFAAIFEHYHQDLYRYCAAILGNAEDAQDAVQNTMLKALRALPGDGRELKLKPWLYRIAHNEAIDMIRARRGVEEIDAETAIGGAGPAEEAEMRGRLRQLISDIAELPDRQRGALVMREMSGLDYEQIGEALQTSPAAARQTIYEARLSLRQLKEGREMPCGEVMRAISDDDGRVLRRRDIRAHLQSCEDCKAFRSEIADRHREFSSLAPLPAAASAAILQGLLGGAGGGAGAAGGAAGAAAGKALGGSAAIKSAAAILAVSAIAVVAAGHRGKLDLGLGGHDGAPGKSEPASTEPLGQPAATARRPHSAAGAVAPATSGSARGRPNVDQSTAVAAKSHRPAGGPSSAGPAAEEPPQSNSRHLGESKGSEQAKSAGKPSHPDKGKSSTAPGQAKSPGQAKHAGGGQGDGPAAAAGHPPHPQHPVQPEHSQAAAPGTGAQPHAGGEPGNGNTSNRPDNSGSPSLQR